MYLPLNAKDQTVSWKMQVDLPSNSRDFQISVHKFLPNQFIGRFKTIGNVYLKSFHIFCGQFTYCRHFT